MGRKTLRVNSEPQWKPKGGASLGCRSVLLVDRHALMRRAAAGWINRSAGMVVCGVASGITQALKAVQRLRPDVVVSEIMRPEDLGFIRELHRRHPGLPILVFSIQDERLFGQWVRRAGASGYLTKAAGGDQLVQSIRAVVQRRRAGPCRIPSRIRKWPNLTRWRLRSDGIRAGWQVR